MSSKFLAAALLFLFVALITERTLPIRGDSIAPFDRHDLQPRSASYRWVKRDEQQQQQQQQQQTPPASAPAQTSDAQTEEAELLEEEPPGQVETNGDTAQSSSSQQAEPGQGTQPPAGQPQPPQSEPNQQVIADEKTTQASASQEKVPTEQTGELEADEQVATEDPKASQEATNQQPPPTAVQVSSPQQVQQQPAAPISSPSEGGVTVSQQVKQEEVLEVSEEEKEFSEQEEVQTVKNPQQVSSNETLPIAANETQTLAEPNKDQLPTGLISHEPLQAITTEGEAVPPESHVQEPPGQVVITSGRATNNTARGEPGNAEARENAVPVGEQKIAVDEKKEVVAAAGIEKVLTNQIPKVGQPVEEVQLQTESPPVFDYQIDPVSCSPDKLNLPGPILNMTIERILSRLNDRSNCTGKLELELNSVVNKRIKGYVMEVGSMPIEIGALVGETSSSRSLVSCNGEKVSANETASSSSAPTISFGLKFAMSAPDRWLASKWRRYARLRIDDLPLQVFGRMDGQRKEMPQLVTGQQTRAGVGSSSGKCEKFKLESGDFQLLLSEHQVEFVVQVTFAKLDERTYASAAEFGGQIEISRLNLASELYLEHKISVDELNRQRLTGLASPTVQILHDNDNYYRRNNWLMDMYGNWLRHEYRGQLTKLFAGGKLVKRLNSVCFN